MKNYQHILLGIDLSERSADVAERAALLAQALGARMDLLHVLEHVPEDFPSDVVPQEGLDKMDVMKKRATEAMAAIAQRFNIKDPDFLLGVGSVKDEILRIAQEQHADLLVVGSHERHGLALLRVSVTDRVLHGARCDVLAVHLPQ